MARSAWFVCLMLTIVNIQEGHSAAPQAARDVAARIDAILQEAWDAAQITPAAMASDSEFLRRGYLDLVGTVPPAAVVRDYLASNDTAKRERLIDRLLTSPRHATHLANTWRRILLPDGFPADRSADALGMQQWLRGRFAENMRYDRLVGDFITADGGSEAGPVLFYQALDVKPEKLAASTARIFLGIQIQCAQCHDHPFDDWTQRDFWEYAAFFARVNGEANMGYRQFRLRDVDFGEVTLPEQDEPIGPAFPGKDQPAPQALVSRRLQLSIWLSSESNPFLARATANRVWWLMFGRGLVEPVDDLSPLNAASHPQVLDLLSEFFVASDYNLRELFRAVALTRAYGLSSQVDADDQPPSPELFAAMAIKSLTPEQVFDSLVQAVHNNQRLTVESQPPISLTNAARQRFLARMGSEVHRPLEYSADLQQTLLLMNSSEINGLLADADHGLLAALSAPFLDPAARVEAIVLNVLGRLPDDSERETFTSYLSAQDDDDSRAAAMADMVWALVNSAEFRLNH